MTYTEKLRDPRWQRKRLQILERDEFQCVLCQETINELHVHHLTYQRGLDPWDYPDNHYATLCIFCHERIERCIAAARWFSCFPPYLDAFDALMDLVRNKTVGNYARLLDRVRWFLPEEYTDNNYEI